MKAAGWFNCIVLNLLIGWYIQRIVKNCLLIGWYSLFLAIPTCWLVDIYIVLSKSASWLVDIYTLYCQKLPADWLIYIHCIVKNCLLIGSYSLFWQNPTCWLVDIYIVLSKTACWLVDIYKWYCQKLPADWLIYIHRIVKILPADWLI